MFFGKEFLSQQKFKDSLKLFKDDIQIYLKADYTDSKELRRELLIAMSRNHDYTKISNCLKQELPIYYL